MPFKPFSSSSTQKITRKKNDIHLQNDDFYPSAGHCSIKITQNSCFLWWHTKVGRVNMAKQFIYITFDVEDDDVSIDTMTKKKQSGAIFPPLQGSSAFFFINDSIFGWGGLNLEQFNTSSSNELIQLRVQKDKYTVEIIQENNNFSISSTVISGSVPSARCGHTLTLCRYNIKKRQIN